MDIIELHEAVRILDHVHTHTQVSFNTILINTHTKKTKLVTRLLNEHKSSVRYYVEKHSSQRKAFNRNIHTSLVITDT